MYFYTLYQYTETCMVVVSISRPNIPIVHNTSNTHTLCSKKKLFCFCFVCLFVVVFCLFFFFVFVFFLFFLFICVYTTTERRRTYYALNVPTPPPNMIDWKDNVLYKVVKFEYFVKGLYLLFWFQYSHHMWCNPRESVGSRTCDIFQFSTCLKSSLGEIHFAENLTLIRPVVPKLQLKDSIHYTVN